MPDLRGIGSRLEQQRPSPASLCGIQESTVGNQNRGLEYVGRISSQPPTGLFVLPFANSNFPVPLPPSSPTSSPKTSSQPLPQPLLPPSASPSKPIPTSATSSVSNPPIPPPSTKRPTRPYKPASLPSPSKPQLLPPFPLPAPCHP